MLRVGADEANELADAWRAEYQPAMEEVRAGRIPFSKLDVLHRRKGQEGVREMPDFFAALREVGLPLQPILAGGAYRTRQEREQWSSACNFLAVRPGTIVSYRRNEATICELQAAGFRVVPAVNFLAFDDWSDAKHRTVVTIEGSELARGGGGPRCMSLPLRRAPL